MDYIIKEIAAILLVDTDSLGFIQVKYKFLYTHPHFWLRQMQIDSMMIAYFSLKLNSVETV